MISRNDAILHAPVGTEETVMMSADAGKYYGLNAVASRVWELLESPKTVAQLRAQICEEFETDVQTCESDILKFVNEMINNGIVHVASA
jgi:hypothetical protein